jgi:hypothetical protein
MSLALGADRAATTTGEEVSARPAARQARFAAMSPHRDHLFNPTAEVAPGSSNIDHNRRLNI